jgi:hypothetical protein
MHPLFMLAFATFVLIIGWLAWNKVAVKKQIEPGPTTGIGGPNDPVAGATENLRHPDEMRQSLDEAGGRPLHERQTEYADNAPRQ